MFGNPEGLQKGNFTTKSGIAQLLSNKKGAENYLK